MTNIYDQNGNGTLWLTQKNDEKYSEEYRQKVIDYIDEKDGFVEEPLFGSNIDGGFQLDEMYLDKNGDIFITGVIGHAFISLSIPVKPTDEFKEFLKDLNEFINLNNANTGLSLETSDFEEIRKKKADSQGRINLGKERAGKELRVVILNE